MARQVHQPLGDQDKRPASCPQSPRTNDFDTSRLSVCWASSLRAAREKEEIGGIEAKDWVRILVEWSIDADKVSETGSRLSKRAAAARTDAF